MGRRRSSRSAGEGPPSPTLRPVEEAALGEAVANLATLDLAGLRLQWRNVFGGSAPVHLPKPLLARILAYRLRADAFGDLPDAVRRTLEGFGARGSGRGGRRPTVGRAARRPTPSAALVAGPAKEKTGSAARRARQRKRSPRRAPRLPRTRPAEPALEAERGVGPTAERRARPRAHGLWRMVLRPPLRRPTEGVAGAAVSAALVAAATRCPARLRLRIPACLRRPRPRPRTEAEAVGPCPSLQAATAATPSPAPRQPQPMAARRMPS